MLIKKLYGLNFLHYSLFADSEVLFDDAFIYQLAEEIGKPWKKIGIYLGINQGELGHIDKDNKNNSADAAFEMLKKWRDGGQATAREFRQLVDGLKKAGQKDVVAKLEGKVNGTYDTICACN